MDFGIEGDIVKSWGNAGQYNRQHIRDYKDCIAGILEVTQRDAVKDVYLSKLAGVIASLIQAEKGGAPYSISFNGKMGKGVKPTAAQAEARINGNGPGRTVIHYDPGLDKAEYEKTAWILKTRELGYIVNNELLGKNGTYDKTMKHVFAYCALQHAIPFSVFISDREIFDEIDFFFKQRF